jgi:hypothetical protein
MFLGLRGGFLLSAVPDAEAAELCTPLQDRDAAYGETAHQSFTESPHRQAHR